MSLYSPFFDVDNDEGSGVKDSGGTLFPSTSVLSGLRLNGENDHTIEFWMKPSTLSVTNSPQGIIEKRNSTGGGQSPYFYALLDGGGFRSAVRSSNANLGEQRQWNQSVINLIAGQWDHWAFTLDISAAFESKWHLYKNGVDLLTGSSAGQAATVNSIYSSNGDFVLMSPEAGGDTVGGQLFDVRIWNTLRTPAQINENYTKLLDDPAGEANLVGNWYRGVDDDHTDASSEGNNLATYGGDDEEGIDILFLLDDPLLLGNAMEATFPEPRPGARILGQANVSQAHAGAIKTISVSHSGETLVVTNRTGLIKYPLP